MRVSCLQENLSKGLGIVGRAVATRSTLPVTQNVLLSTDNGRLRLAATNLEIAITTWIGAKVETDGALTVPARLISEFVGSLPQDRIDLEATARPRAINIKCQRNEVKVHGTDAEEFPPIPTVTDGPVATIAPQALRTAIARVVFAAATEESRPVLTGVKLDIAGDRFTLAAADGFRLAVQHGKLVESVSQLVSAIIPAKALQELQRLLADQEEPVQVVLGQSRNQALFRLKDVEMVTQLVQGTFPNYTQLIPQSYKTRMVIDLRDFSQASKTASIFARDGSGIIRINGVPGENGEGKLLVAARAEELGENTGELPAKVEGEESKIAFNSRYLQDVLGVLDKGSIVLETTGPSSPGVFKPAEASDYVHVVMPMFVQW